MWEFVYFLQICHRMQINPVGHLNKISAVLLRTFRIIIEIDGFKGTKETDGEMKKIKQVIIDPHRIISVNK